MRILLHINSLLYSFQPLLYMLHHHLTWIVNVIFIQNDNIFLLFSFVEILAIQSIFFIYPLISHLFLFVCHIYKIRFQDYSSYYFNPKHGIYVHSYMFKFVSLALTSFSHYNTFIYHHDSILLACTHTPLATLTTNSCQLLSINSLRSILA